MSQENSEKEILVSAIKPSGRLHIGNYFGAIKPMVNLVNDGKYESYIFVADYHSMTTLYDKYLRTKYILEIVATYLAAGLNPEKVNIFKQSDVSAVTELAWIFSTVTPVPMLFLAHSFKEKREENIEKMKDVNAGLFNYPVLMAADILIYNADIIPVGKDQEQHVEIAREIGGKYNRAYHVDTFKMPQALIKKEVATVPGIDGNKMSKSKGNVIPIFLSQEFTLEDLKKQIMKIKTDSLRPEEKKNLEDNLIYQIHKLFLNSEQDEILQNKFLNSSPQNPYSYKEAKEELLQTIVNYFVEMNKKYLYFTETEAGKKELIKVVESGAIKAKYKANLMMQKVRQDTGLDFL